MMTFAPHCRSALSWKTLAVSAALSLAALSASAAPLAAGSALPTLTLKDQHDKPVAIAPDTRWVLFSGDKAVSDMVSGVLTAEPAGVLQRLHLVYVADISAMPGLVTRMFALPKMRELPYSLALVREKADVAQVADLPRQPGKATLLQLDKGKVTHVSAIANAAELRAALQLPPAKTAP